MPNVNITVRNKIASAESNAVVCGNSDYTIVFNFDAEWNAYESKTARFVWNGQYEDVAFNGNSVNMPIINGTLYVAIGVYAGELHTTTPAILNAKKSILCDAPIHVDPPEDVYNQLMELLNAKQNKLTAGQNITIVGNVISASGGGGGTSDHNALTNRDASNQHPMSAITGLEDALDGKQPIGDYATTQDVSDLADIVDGKADASDIPSLDGYATEQWVDNQGYLTEHQSLDGYATEDYVNAHHDSTKQDVISDLSTIRNGASKGATAVQPESGKGLFSGNYNDLTNKPTIPAAVTEYLKSASVSGNTLNLTKQDDSMISFTPQGGGGGDTWHFIRSVTASTEHIDQNVSYVTDENGNVCGFTFDKDADGNAFSYKDIAAVGILKGSQNVSFGFLVGEITDNTTLVSFRNNTDSSFRAFQWKTETLGAKRFASGEYCTQYASNAIRFAPNYLANSAGFINPQNFMNFIPDARQVNKISAYTGATTVYVEGIIYFYGKN